MKRLLALIFFSVVMFSSCKRKGWSKEFKDKFLTECNQYSRDMTAEQVKTYCDCVADKAEKAYPNEKEVETLPDDKVLELKKSCGGK